ncbi:MAG TPA: hypothetical protein VFN35_20605, partial [Ktedonobacteraceae bacterium]|nr:hypothetical protein [Ktedonobacteraceae bacterium]
MPATDDYFIPEKIDEQIDQLTQNHPLDNTNEEALVSALHSHYQSPPQEEEKVFLRHARQRILASKASTDDLKSPRATLARKRSPQKPRSRLVHMLQGLAAVLAVTMLVAGWLVITQSIRQPAATTLAAQQEDLYIV